MSARLFLALAAIAVPSTVSAQAMVQPLGLTDADRLATQMRQLAANPRDLNALATAGELSLRVGDLSGAAALFARADKVDPRSGRVKAGMAAILVRSERPGEALRFFAQAEAYGWPALRFAADRGLAYDLIGEQERAQRDYRLALRNASDEETVRRYGLSLGISGRQREALEQLDPLVRRQDRAAWRARAFVLAMGGDSTGAAKIATAMMPATVAQGLGAFFGRLPALGPVDRAFAVHFGEVYATPERVADARLTPALQPLLPEPGAAPPVRVAALVPARDRRSRRERERDERRAARSAATSTRPPAAAPVALASAQTVPRPAAPVVRQTPPSAVAARPTTQAPVATMRETDVRVAGVPAQPVSSVAVPVARPVILAAAPPVTTAVPVSAATVTPAVPSPVTTAPVSVAAVPPAMAPVGVAAVAPAPVVTSRSAVTAASILPAVTPSVPAANPFAATPVPIATLAAQPPVAAVAPAASPPPPAVLAAVAPVAGPSAPVAGPPAPVLPVETASATERTDSVLARIVASLSIPASELGVAPVRPDPAAVPIPPAVIRVPASPAGKRIVAEASAKEARDAVVRRTVAAKLTGDPEADEPARGRTRKEPPLDPKAKRVAAAKALADKKVADEKKALAAKEAEERRIARTKPARIWVQVAGGANESDLSKAWRAAQAKAPALKARTGYSTPLRATNRVLTGPFQSEAEARTLINQLAKQGVSAFSFTSAAGQDVKTLGRK